ncbi:RNA polymerase sigma factor [Enterococcus sp. DIV0876]|uniref:RNA polymerase sigma factor n=1 Tax=Enterococcus sp. DIV0876 TaxID=2774633 RepID=UPI003D2FD4E2
MQIDSYQHYLFTLTKDLVHYLQSIGANVQDAEDIAQEALVKILEIDTVLAADELRPWLFRVGINHYFNLYNQTKRRNRIVKQYLQPTKEATWQETDDALYDALLQLPLPTATLLAMKYIEGRSIKEISFLLNRPEDSIKTSLYRGRKQLKKMLEEAEK